jgi:teichuronic acid exporter
MLDTFFRNIYGLLIGKFFSPASLAFYNRGRNLPNMLATSITRTVSQVIFPVLSTIQDDAARMKAVVRRAMTTISVVLWPMLIGLAVTAEPFVRVVLTDKWLPAVPYMRIMCIVSATLPIHIANLQVINAVGRSDIFLKLEIIKKVLIVLVLIVTFRFGVYAMVLGQLGLSINALFLNSHYSGKFIGYSTWQQLRDLAPVAMVTAVMAGVVYGVGLLKFPNVYIQLLTQAFVGAIVYIGICRAVRLACFADMQDMLAHMFKRKSSSK